MMLKESSGICFRRVGGKMIRENVTYTEREELEIVKRIKQIIDEEYASRLTVDEIAAKINYSKKQTQRIFLKETGKTVYEYLTEFRIEKAREMLADGTAKISSVAERVGYKNKSHFKELFLKHSGISPAEFKKVTDDE